MAADPRPGPTASGAARRVEATVCFASVVGFTALSERVGPERAYLAVTGCLRGLDAIARRHGGAVDKYQGDALMVVFGHPVQLAQRARAAVEAALEMRRHVRETDRALGLPVRLLLQTGIATGPMVAGPVRGPVVREFHVLGDVVNVAARLKAKAPPDAIRADAATVEAAGDHFAWGPALPLALKGKSRPVAAHDVLGARGPRVASTLRGDDAAGPPLVGRDAERGRLAAAAAALAAGRGGALLLRGEEGSGKTRLLAELEDLLAPEVVRLALRPSPDGPERPGGLAADLLASLGEGGARGDPTPDRVDPAALRAALERAVAARPLVLAIDDADRLDEASRDALAAVVDLAATRPLLVVLAGGARPDGALGRRLAALGPACEEILLPALPEPEALRLLAGLPGAEALAPEGRALLIRRAAGNCARLVQGVHLAEALASEQAQAERAERSTEAERRRATIVFADLSGFTAMTERLGAETAYPIVSGCLALLDEVARRHGGHVEKHLGDCVMATFGLPEAIEDAPRAALNAAIEMRSRVRGYNEEHGIDPPLELHVGVHTGLGIAGDVSGPLLREFAVMGEPVEVAARLTDQAGAGQILVGPDTWRLTRHVFAFRPPPPPAGDAGARLEAHELTSERARLHRERIGAERRVFAPLVGRERELAALGERVAGLAAGRGGVAAVVAEAGLGKSRLVAELRAAPAAQEAAWLVGRSLSTGRSLRFHPFADLLRAWAGIDDDDDDRAARERLAQAVGALGFPAEADVDALLAQLLALPLEEEERERLARIGGESLEKLVHGAVAGVLTRSAARRPVAIVMDDLHWADDSSLELLANLVPLAARHPLLFLLVARPSWTATGVRVAEAARAVDGQELATFRLAPLTRGDARALLGHLFETDALPHATRAAIEEKSQGNPFFIEEVVRSLVDQGAVAVGPDGFRATERIAGIAIPDSLHGVVMSRVDRLPAARRTLLQLAAVVGRSFHERVLAAVVGDRERVRRELEALADAEFVTPWDQTRGTEWAFRHPLLHEVTYEGLLETRRTALHGEVARAVEEHLPPETPGWAGMLAWHHTQAGDAERAEEFLLRAGEDAARVAASSEALQFFEQASRLYLERHGEGGDPRKKARLAHHVALALFHRGRLVEADEHFQRALEHLGESVPRRPLPLALGFARNAAGVLARLFVPRLARQRPAGDVDREVIDLLWARAQTQTTVSPTRFLFDSMAGLARLDGLEPRTVPGAGGMYAGAVGIFSYGGVSFGIGRRFLARAADLVSPDDVPERLVYRMMDFLHAVLAGDWSDAHRVEDELLEEGLRYGRLWEVTNVLNLEGLQRIYRGDWSGGAECIERLGKIAEQYRHALAASAQRFLVAMRQLERRELAAAIATLDEYLDEHPEPAFQVSALGHRAVAQWLGGDVEGARATLARAARRRAEASTLLPYHAADERRAALLLAVHDLEASGGGAAAGRGLARARRGALRTASRVAWRRPEVLRLAGTAAWLRGRRARAERAWAESLACAAALGMRPEWARTQAERGRRLRAAGARAEAERALAAAVATFEALGLEREREAAAVPDPAQP